MTEGGAAGPEDHATADEEGQAGAASPALPGAGDSVDDDIELYRRVPPAHYKWEDGKPVLREGCFKNFPRPELKRMSVALADTLALEGKDAAHTIAGMPDYGVVSITAKDARDVDQTVERTPKDDDPAHGDVVGEKPGRVRKDLRDKAKWVIEPPPP